MNKEQFERLALGAIIAGLLYVPTHICHAYTCVSRGWEFIFLFENSSLDFSRLIIQEAVIVILLGYYWKKKFKE